MGGGGGGSDKIGLEGKGSGLSWYFLRLFFPSPFGVPFWPRAKGFCAIRPPDFMAYFGGIFFANMGSYAIKVGVRAPYSLWKSLYFRDFYPIRPPDFMAYFGGIFFANMGVGFVKLFSTSLRKEEALGWVTSKAYASWGPVYHLSQNYYITARYFWTINSWCRNVKITLQKLFWNSFWAL